MRGETMDKPLLLASMINPLYVQTYERYLPTAFDESMTLLDKVNKVIVYLNEIGKLSNDVLEQWNQVVDWVMSDGLDASLSAKLDSMVADGSLEKLINQDIFADLNTQITTVSTDLTAAKTDLSNVKTDVSYFDKNGVSVLKFGAKGDGVTDDTAAIQAAISSNYDVIYFPSGTYLLAGNVTLNHPVSLIGLGNAVFKKPSGNTNIDNNYFFIASNLNNLLFKGLTFDGNRSNNTRGNVNNTCLDIRICNNVVVEECTFKNIQGGGSNVNTAVCFVDESDYCKVLNCKFENLSCGAMFTQGKYTIFANNQVNYADDVAIVFNSQLCAYGLAYGNTIIDGNGGVIGCEGGPSYITIAKNHIKNIRTGYGIGVMSLGSPNTMNNIVITDNTIDGCSGTNVINGITTQGADTKDVIISNNLIANLTNGNQYNVAIALFNPRTIVKGNILKDLTCDGIAINSSGVTVTDNHVHTTANAVNIIELNSSPVDNVLISQNYLTGNIGIYSNTGNNKAEILYNRITASNGRISVGAVGQNANFKVVDSYIGGVQHNQVMATYTKTVGQTVPANSKLVVGLDTPIAWSDGNYFAFVHTGTSDIVGQIGGTSNGGVTLVIDLQNISGADVSLGDIKVTIFSLSNDSSFLR
jgi:hypothetical protein